MFQLINDKGNIIAQLDDWTRPKKEEHWKCGRSAMEFARFWTAPKSSGTIPPDYQELLYPVFPGTKFHVGRPEWPTSLPPRGSKGSRTHDLHLLGTWLSGSLTVCVEAKTDEPFEETLSQYKVNAEQELRSNPRSRQKERLEDLLDSIWGVRKFTESQSCLRYQLLHALVGTAIQALIDVGKAGNTSSGTGVLLIHVFETCLTKKHKLEKNQRDLEKFGLALPNVTISATGIVSGCLYGPAAVTVPADFAPLGCPTLVDVFLGKLVTVLN